LQGDGLGHAGLSSNIKAPEKPKEAITLESDKSQSWKGHGFGADRHNRFLRVPTEITASFQRRFQEAKVVSIEAVIFVGALKIDIAAAIVATER
jgi:hypothetical protein